MSMHTDPGGSHAGLDGVLHHAREAFEALRPEVVRTPLLQHPELDARAGAVVSVKAETLQRAGSFKYRGAMNAIRLLTEKERARGVVAFSSGNHAIAVATAAARRGVNAVVIMPSDAPSIKIHSARAAGASVALYDRVHDDREQLSQYYVESQGRALIPPFDDARVIAGAATGALEALEQLKSCRPDVAVICCSGGGLAAGWSAVLRTLAPSTEIWIVEPSNFDDTGRSLELGHPVENVARTGSICDALLAPSPGRLTLALMAEAGARGVTVSDDEVRLAMWWCFTHMKLVVEPGGAAAVAACLFRKIDVRGRRVLTLVSGANVDTKTFASVLMADLPQRGLQ